MSLNPTLEKLEFNFIAPVRIAGALYLIFAAGDVAAIVGVLFLLQELDVTLEVE